MVKNSSFHSFDRVLILVSYMCYMNNILTAWKSKLTFMETIEKGAINTLKKRIYIFLYLGVTVSYKLYPAVL